MYLVFHVLLQDCMVKRSYNFMAPHCILQPPALLSFIEYTLG